MPMTCRCQYMTCHNAQVEANTAQSMQRLVELDKVKTRMQLSAKALQVRMCNVIVCVYYGGGRNKVICAVCFVMCETELL